MAKKQSHLGELELVVLKAIWEHQPCTVQRIAGMLGKRRGCARTTVLTVMQRLHAKGFLKRRKVGRVFQYSSTEQRSTVMSRLIGQFLDNALRRAGITHSVGMNEVTRTEVRAANFFYVRDYQLECACFRFWVNRSGRTLGPHLEKRWAEWID